MKNLQISDVFFIKKGFDVINHQNYVFFDIDCTLSSSVDEDLRIKSDQYCIDYANSLGFIQSDFEIFNVYDFSVPQKSSLDLFGYFLKITNSKAICISSWASITNGEKAIEEIERMFSLISDQFPKNWLIGCSDGCGGDRWEAYIKPFSKIFHPESKHVAFDDGAHEYSNTETTVHVDSMSGFNESDFIKGLKILDCTNK